jgi:hypothetical protein
MRGLGLRQPLLQLREARVQLALLALQLLLALGIDRPADGFGPALTGRAGLLAVRGGAGQKQRKSRPDQAPTRRRTSAPGLEVISGLEVIVTDRL